MCGFTVLCNFYSDFFASYFADPIPGGCAQTSALDYEAALTSQYDNQSTTVYFQVCVFTCICMHSI